MTEDGLDAPDPRARGIGPMLQCPCGELIVGSDEDDLVEKAEAHLAGVHPELAGRYGREEILFLAF